MSLRILKLMLIGLTRRVIARARFLFKIFRHFEHFTLIFGAAPECVFFAIPSARAARRLGQARSKGFDAVREKATAPDARARLLIRSIYQSFSATANRPAKSCTNCQATRPEREPRVVAHSSASRRRASASIGIL